MKKVFLIMLVAVFGVMSANAQLNFGVKAGLNVADLSGAEGADPKMGIHVGVAAQYLLSPEMGIETGLYYSMLGAKSGETKATPSYLQLPVHFLYKFGVGPDLYLVPSAGIYLGYGIAGQYKVGSESIDYFGKEVENNRFDFGVGAAVNLQYSKFTIGVGYDLGLLKVNKESESGVKDITNLNLKVSVGYFF